MTQKFIVVDTVNNKTLTADGREEATYLLREILHAYRQQGVPARDWTHRGEIQSQFGNILAYFRLDAGRTAFHVDTEWDLEMLVALQQANNIN